MNVNNFATLRGRKIEFFSAENQPEWGYTDKRRNSFAVLYPEDTEAKNCALYVVFHSAGHDLYSTLSCTEYENNHNIYQTPKDMYGLYLDCREWEDTDWWWGGWDEYGNIDKTDREGKRQPVENRVYATIDWTVKNFPIDADRIYGVGNSMGGTGALGIAATRGDIFAAIKVNVPAGVLHFFDRYDNSIEPPVIVDYSGTDDIWSKGHDRFYKGADELKFSVFGFWGAFGHENNHARIYEFNDLVHSLDIFKLRKNEAYPAFTNASANTPLPWPDHTDCKESGQVNAFFRWKTLSDTENEVSFELRLMNENDWQTRVTLPEESRCDVTPRRLQNFTACEGVTATFGGKAADVVFENGLLTVSNLTVTKTPAVLSIKKN